MKVTCYRAPCWQWKNSEQTPGLPAPTPTPTPTSCGWVRSERLMKGLFLNFSSLPADGAAAWHRVEIQIN